MVRPSMSPRPLNGTDYVDGEIYDLNLPSRAILREALLNEQWANMSTYSRQHWLGLMFSSTVRFVGTVLSPIRRQVEITIVFEQRHPVYGRIVAFCVTPFDFHRFGALVTH